MRFTNRLVAVAASTAMVGAGLLAVTATSASAATPTGGCWVYGFNPGDPIDSTTPSFDISSGPAEWTDSTKAPVGAAEYTIATGGDNTVGGVRTFSLTFNKTPKSAAPAAGTAYYYFSVNGTNLAPITTAFNIPAGQVQAGSTINGSFPITSAGTNTIKLRKVIYDATASGVRVGCNGQTGATAGAVNPATTPVDTNIAATFSVVGPTATISSISNQVVTTAARQNDVISFSVSNFAAGTGTAEICNTAGTACQGTSSVTIGGGGTGTGTLAVPASPTEGARALKVTSGTDTSLTPITILGQPTVATNVASAGVGSVVTVTGTNWDPNQALSVSGTRAGPPFPPPASTDPAVAATASATGTFTASFTVNDSLTKFIGASRVHAAGPPPVVIFGSTAFSINGDTCTAKVGSAATGECALLQTVKLTVTAGDLKMAKNTGEVQLSGVTLDGTAKTSTGALQSVRVMDYRGGTLGWSLTGKFTGFTGPVAIAPSKLSWTPACAAQTNSDDTVTAGAAGAFADATTAQPLCSVAVGGLGADAVSGGDAVADAGLSLGLAANQAAGNYNGTLTLTLS